jgi:CheY-like chemotaxis protein
MDSMMNEPLRLGAFAGKNPNPAKRYFPQSRKGAKFNRGEIFTAEALSTLSKEFLVKNSPFSANSASPRLKLRKIMDGKKILLVEDNPVNRRLAVFLLRAHGYEVREATTAQEALEMLEKERADLIVMDIQLPGMDGLEATKKLKQQPNTADIPVVAVTSYAMKGDREKALAAGCAGYVTKPIDKNIFIQEVAARLGNSSKIED